ncbi:hypothetical protein ACCQ08_23170, partial [Comamonas sp. SY3]|uniref:hypothetical protein n=1 Tax=Comamonas sp. SY3 TaxID=3243601 RepID=UPI0035945580
MAENNSSAPLKTAEGAEHPHLIALRTIAEYPATDSLMNMDAANMRRIAAQAVAAQAAPAAVATPDQIAFLNSDRDGWIEAHAKIYRAYQDLRNAADDLLTCVMHDGVLVDPEHPKRIAVEAVKAALCTTPALPATEDSSAGDLAEVQAEPVSSDPVAWHSKLYGTCWMHKQPYHLDAGTHFFVRGNPNPVATVLSGAAIQWHTGTAALEHGTFFYTAPQAQPADALTRAALDVL